MFPNPFGYAHHYSLELGGTKRVLCAPPKNACSLVKFISITQKFPEYTGVLLNEPACVHRYSHLALVKQHMGVWNTYQPLAFVRHPYLRAISAYLSKFILFPEDEVLSDIVGIVELSPADMTFRQFFKALLDMPDEWLDPHFRQQYSFFVRHPSEYVLIDINSSHLASS